MFIHRIDQHLYLKILDISDANDLFELTSRSRAHLRTWLPWVDETKDVEDSKIFIQSSLERLPKNNGFTTGIWYKNELAGVISFHEINWKNHSTSIGYWLGEGFTGNGIMLRSTKALIKYAFNELKLNRIEIRCATDNIKSKAIPEKLGFVKEGVLRQSENLPSGFVDHFVYAILKEDWENRKNP
ncbi:GNAT family N-acetyltransferase [Aquibacillus rhizosphaerae]|uniref:GNAT family protein n=1 Tax=Aquibacillus rhizosphaerae TaxID=3051431 RepID=A0ABT7L7K4_9BACI|nr:GNAT family protein [Aquibacillus sp. LR5S19]MDL4841844.1 GNAT family protein [Aquibacillus sp. LR5S19]